MELLESALKETPQLDCLKVLGLEELIKEAQENVEEVKRRIKGLFRKRAYLIYSHSMILRCAVTILLYVISFLVGFLLFFICFLKVLGSRLT